MKKLIVLIIATMVAFGSYAASGESRNDTTAVEMSTSVETDTYNEAALLQRLDEINAMDKSNLTRAEKKELREEVRSIKSGLEEGGGGGGVYISVGAILIIILLLIILL